MNFHQEETITKVCVNLIPLFYQNQDKPGKHTFATIFEIKLVNLDRRHVLVYNNT